MKIIDHINKFRPLESNPIGWNCFQLGLFLLPSTVLLSGLFFLVALVLGSKNRQFSYLKDLWNFPLLIASSLMIIGCFTAYSEWLSWVGLANWLPLFWAFWAFQPYLTNSHSRRFSGLVLLAGTVPVVLTGFGQLLLGWTGPWDALGGLIIWHVVPGGQPFGRLSGLFDYANIAGAWLAIIWPFSLAALIHSFAERRNKSASFFIVLAIAIAIAIAILLTDSRNAWGAFLLAIPFLYGTSTWIWLLPLFAFLVTPIFISSFPGVPLSIQEFFRFFVPQSIWERLSDIRFDRAIEATRLNQWKLAILFILEKPFLGWGAAAFSIIYTEKTGLWHGHAHNLPLELAVAHGLPASLLIIGMALKLLYESMMRGVISKKARLDDKLGTILFDRAWWTATLIIIFLHAFDIPLFDSRINILSWVLLAGLRALIKPSTNLNLNTNI